MEWRTITLMIVCFLSGMATTIIIAAFIAASRADAHHSAETAHTAHTHNTNTIQTHTGHSRTRHQIEGNYTTPYQTKPYYKVVLHRFLACVFGGDACS